jgi:proline iminopeptidase
MGPTRRGGDGRITIREQETECFLAECGYHEEMNDIESRTGPMHPPGRLVEVRDTRLWVETEGAGEPLVLLAGGPASSHVCFHPAFSQLSNDFSVIYYDYRGRGRSDSPDDVRSITFADDVADLDALRTALGLEQVNLYGFSYGGLVAQQYALLHPQRVSRLVLANTVHSAEMWQRNHENIIRELQNQYPEVWEEIDRLRTAGHLSSSGEMQALFAKHSAVVRWFNPDNAQRLLTEPGARRLDLYFAFVGEDIEFFIGGEVARFPDFRPQLKQLRMPVLILAGRFDRALYPKLQMDFKRFCPQATFVMLERSGTFGHLEEPETVMPLLREFLAP